MNYLPTIVSMISMLGTLIAIYFALKNGKRTDDADFQKRVEENTRINLKLDEISNKTSDIKDEVQNISKIVQSHDIKLTELDLRCRALEERVKELEHK